MILKKRTKPVEIQKRESLLRRLGPTHDKRSKIELDLKNKLAGYRGEENLDYHLTFLPEKEYFIFQDLQLPTPQNDLFQMDALVLSSSLIIIIESKNFKGTLKFDPNTQQMKRMVDDQEEGFSCPIAQVNRHKIQLQRWITNYKLKAPPIETLVSISSPSTIIHCDFKTSQKVLHAEHIPQKIIDLATPLKSTISIHQLNILSEKLLVGLESREFDVLEHYEISRDEIVSGVYCPSCNHQRMKRIHSNWICHNCSTKSKIAHQSAIEDYLFLFSNITNAECRKFLELNSMHQAKRILNSMNLKKTGIKKGTVYHHRN